jgi:hypothetical protein
MDVRAGQSPCSQVRLFIDTVSLATWKQEHNPAFDLSTLCYYLAGERKAMWTQNYLGTARDPKFSATGVIRARLPTIWALATSKRGKEINARDNVKINIPYKGVDIDKVNTREAVSSYCIFTMPERDSKVKAKKVAIRLVEHIINRWSLGSQDFTGATRAAQSIRYAW